MEKGMTYKFLSFMGMAIFLSALLLVFLQTSSSPGSAQITPQQSLSEGKNLLDKGDYENAIAHLTAAYENLPVMGDYALFWRAQAFKNIGNIDDAINDLIIIKNQYKDSPLIKTVRLMEIELLREKNDSGIITAYQDFIADYPSDLNVKYAFALYLHENNEKDRAKNLFKEIFLSASPLSKKAAEKLLAGEITIEDLILRGQNLNKAWFFEDAEKSFREALEKEPGVRSQESGGELKTQILEGLAYSLFRQRSHKEASVLYEKIKYPYWLAKSLLRARETEAFESRLQEFLRSRDKRMASVLISYGTTKRRNGDIDGALNIFNEVLSRFPSEREDTLWATAWTYYLSGSYKKALEIFSHLHNTYTDSQFQSSRYLYWKNKSKEKLGIAKPAKALYGARHIPHRDYYGYLTLLKDGQTLKTVERSQPPGLPVLIDMPQIDRVDILAEIGLTREAVSELLHMSRRNPSPDMIVYISSYLQRLGSYRMSVGIISRIPYDAGLHEFYYPLAFLPEVEEAARRNGIDPLLILSVMREESRFDPEARSIAGALGLMQLMPRTAQRIAKPADVSLRHLDQLYDPKTNVIMGTYYLRQLLDTFNSIPVALAAYNAGERVVSDWLKRGNYDTIDEFIEDIPFRETRNYVKRVLTTYFEYIRASENSDISEVSKYIGNL
jgi:soluble lytic murein transglycosylase